MEYRDKPIFGDFDDEEEETPFVDQCINTPGFLSRVKGKLKSLFIDHFTTIDESFEDMKREREEKKRRQQQKIDKLYEKFKHRYTKEDINDVYEFLKACFDCSENLSANYLVHQLLMNVKYNKLSEKDAMVVYHLVVQDKFGTADPQLFKALYEGIGNIKGGATTDVIPGAKGEFGYDITNPIPINGVFQNRIYLESLQLDSGKEFTWKRLGCTSTRRVKGMIDIYELFDIDGEKICTLYLAPYQNKTSEKAPEGFHFI